MKILVCGGRDYRNSQKVIKVLHQYKPRHIITGCAEGADKFAFDYALRYKIPVTKYYANWLDEGKKAGPLRNEKMLNENLDTDLVIAFPGGRGTANMIEYAKMLGVKIIQIED